MFCYKCGNQLPDTAVFCNKCGVKTINDNTKVQANIQVNVNSAAIAQTPTIESVMIAGKHMRLQTQQNCISILQLRMQI